MNMPYIEKLQRIKEKTRAITDKCRGICVDFYLKNGAFFKRISYAVVSNKKNVLIGVTAVVALAGVGVASFYAFQWWQHRNESQTFSTIRKGELFATGVVGSKIVMGDLEISLIDVIEGVYHPLELDKDSKRVPPRGYFGAQVMIFNTSYNQKEFLLFGLTDDLENQYERDLGIDFYVDGVIDFGPAKEIYPRTIRGGGSGKEKLYVFFPAPDPNAKKIQFMVMDETVNKKVVFEIER